MTSNKLYRNFVSIDMFKQVITRNTPRRDHEQLIVSMFYCSYVYARFCLLVFVNVNVSVCAHAKAHGFKPGLEPEHVRSRNPPDNNDEQLTQFSQNP